jgi:predicted nucleic acid-binding protein
LKSAVVDASVACKWILPSADEPYSKHALELLDRYALKEIQILVPDLFWAEIGNVLWKAVRTHRITIEDARIGLQKVTGCNFPTVPSFSLLTRAFEIASTFGRSFYDCLYVALAESSDAELITADEKLVNALALQYPVKWLGAI